MPWTNASYFPKKADSADRKSTRLNSSHTVIYTLSLHDALPIFAMLKSGKSELTVVVFSPGKNAVDQCKLFPEEGRLGRSEEHTSELQSHRDLHSFPTRRSSDLCHVEIGQK